MTGLWCTYRFGVRGVGPGWGLYLSGWVAEWWCSHSLRVAEWLRFLVPCSSSTLDFIEPIIFLDVLCPLLYSQMGRQILKIQSEKNRISWAVFLSAKSPVGLSYGDGRMEHLAVASSLGCRRAPRVLTHGRHGHTTSRNQTLVTENSPVVDDFLLWMHIYSGFPSLCY